MKRLILLTLFVAVFVQYSSADDRHFINDADYRARVHTQFEKRRQEATGRGEALFAVMDKGSLTTEQREALEFLYAFMPLSDLADYDGNFFLTQVDYALRARETFSWGKNIPEEVFRHFVLPCRVNNENLDTARVVCFNELKDRVKHLSLHDAILEVNHWCHEKATYRGSDMRTSAPLAMIRTAWGRCGEESTLATTALRAVGIPARQCYVPRWAHSESNHAWVEVWVDGEWHFIGACEPEAELDMAWFTGPGRRAMMVHTNVFGQYGGPEVKNNVSPLFTRINVLENYADTRRINLTTLDADGAPAKAATVKFCVFNGGSLSPVYTGATDDEGRISIVTGRGDIFIWANKGEHFGYHKCTPQENELALKLDLKPGSPVEEAFVLNCTPESPGKDVYVSDEKRQASGRQSAHDDSVRDAYMKTFISEDAARKFARDNSLDEERAWKFLSAAQGNWHDIRDFMLSKKTHPDLFAFLATLSEKDLRDTPLDVLLNHLPARSSLVLKDGVPDEMVVPFVLSPRIESELIRPWREYFLTTIPQSVQQAARKDPSTLAAIVREKIKLNNDENYYECPASPRGTWELGIADRRSRNILFVAMARSFGIPAITGGNEPSYYDGGEWKTAKLDGDNVATTKEPPRGAVIIESEPTGENGRPNYSLTSFADGDFQFRGFGGFGSFGRGGGAMRGANRGGRESGGRNPGAPDRPQALPVDAGYYRILSGQRDSDGSAFIYLRFFEVREGDTVRVKVKRPEILTKIEVKGKIDMNLKTAPDKGAATTLASLAGDKGLAVCFLDPGKEPSKHILQDFPSVQENIESWGGGVLFIVPDDKRSQAFTPDVFKGLPKQAVWATDKKRALLNVFLTTLKTELGDNFPLTLYLSAKGEILYSSLGYKIGAGRDILKVIQLEKERQ
jgi:hypothetical protein